VVTSLTLVVKLVLQEFVSLGGLHRQASLDSASAAAMPGSWTSLVLISGCDLGHGLGIGSGRDTEWAAAPGTVLPPRWVLPRRRARTRAPLPALSRRHDYSSVAVSFVARHRGAGGTLSSVPAGKIRI